MGKQLNLKAGATTETTVGFARLDAIAQSEYDAGSSLNLSARTMSQIKPTEVTGSLRR